MEGASPKVFLCLLLFMVITYTSVNILYPEDDTEYMQSNYNYSSYNFTAFSLAQWMDSQWILSYEIIVNGNTENLHVPILSHYVYKQIYADYKSTMITSSSDYPLSIFSEFGVWEGAGYQWYLSDFCQQKDWGGATTKRDNIREEYLNYKNSIDGNEESNMLDAVFEFFGVIGQGFIQMMKVMTFTNIPHFPPAMTFILNIFFMPMWGYIAISIAPYVSDFMKAIGQLIDAIVPF